MTTSVTSSVTLFIKLVVASAIIAGACYFTWLVTDSKWQSKYDTQQTAYAEASAKAQQAARDQETKYANSLAKANAEGAARQAASELAAANATAATQRLLRRINGLLADTSTEDTGTGLKGKSAEQALNLLADVLRKSIERNRQLATFGDESWDAAKQCEDSYNAIQQSH